MFHEAARAVLGIAVLGRGVNAESMVDRRDYIVGMHGMDLRIRAVPIRFAVNLAGPNAAAGQETAVTRRPVIAAAGTDVISRGRSELG